MSFKKFHPLAVGCVLAVLVSVAPAVFGQVTTTTTQTTQATRDQSLTMRSVPAGSKMKFRGVVISRDADVFTIRDRTRQDYQVLITDNTSIKTNGGFLRSGKRYPVTDILRGLIVEDRKSTRLNSSHTEIYTLSLHDALPILSGPYHRQYQYKNQRWLPSLGQEISGY